MFTRNRRLFDELFYLCLKEAKPCSQFRAAAYTVDKVEDDYVTAFNGGRILREAFETGEKAAGTSTRCQRGRYNSRGIIRRFVWSPTKVLTATSRGQSWFKRRRERYSTGVVRGARRITETPRKLMVPSSTSPKGQKVQALHSPFE